MSINNTEKLEINYTEFLKPNLQSNVLTNQNKMKIEILKSAKGNEQKQNKPAKAPNPKSPKPGKPPCPEKQNKGKESHPKIGLHT